MRVMCKRRKGQIEMEKLTKHEQEDGEEGIELPYAIDSIDTVAIKD